MKQVYNKKHSIAWFKIADYVSRGEKERALGMYRLLSHSIDDQALRAQIEGDILWAFNDYESVQRYKKAAELYQGQQKLLQSAAVWEHILYLMLHEPSLDHTKEDEVAIRKHLVTLYEELGILDAIEHHLIALKDSE